MHLFFFFCAVILASRVTSLDNGLGKIPGIGWNSDYCGNCTTAPFPSAVAGRRNVGGFQNDAFIRHIASFMNTSGLQAMGYRYVNMDAGWNLLTRDASGNLQPDPVQWPLGINATIAYVHSLNLGFGLYGDRGTKDCSGRPGQLGYEAVDAKFFAELEIDWFKEDSCYAGE